MIRLKEDTRVGHNSIQMYVLIKQSTFGHTDILLEKTTLGAGFILK